MTRHLMDATVLPALAVALTLAACGPTDNKHQDATLPANCEAFDFDCGDGDQCVDKNLVCDGNEDCNTGADEEGCGDCQPGWMTCDNGDCVHSAFVCDGVHFNCVDDSDEAHCN